MSQGSEPRHLKQQEGQTDSTGYLHAKCVIARTIRLLRHWNRSPEELLKRRALRRERRLRKAKKTKQPKKSRRFERRRSPPRRGNHQRKTMRAKHRFERFRHCPSCKGESYPTSFNSRTEALISSWLPCFPSEVRTSSMPASNATRSKTESFMRQPRGGRARTGTGPHKAGEGQEFLSWSRKSLISLGSGPATCHKCRWAGKRRIVSRRRARRCRGTGTKRSQLSLSELIAETMSPTQDCTKDVNPTDLSCLQRFRIFPWSRVHGLGFVSYLSGFKSFLFPFGRGQKLYPRDMSAGESHDRQARTVMGNGQMSGESQFDTSCDGTVHRVTAELPYDKVWTWVGDQLGKAFRSNNSGDGPEPGITRAPPNDHELERACLDVFHGAARGRKWPLEWQWDLDCEPAKRRGIELDNQLRVVTLRLEFGSSEGYLHHLELNGLLWLTTLKLSSMGLGGEIPAAMCNLSQLEELDLRGNKLSGEIPAEISNLSQLKKLGLWGNELTGDIPAEICDLPQLESLDLSFNKLTGEIPAKICNLLLLTWLDLRSNRLTGEIPAGICNLSQLKMLGLWGEIPAEICNLSQLKTLELSSNKVTGKISAGICDITQLKELCLWGNQLTGEIPAEICNLTQVKLLFLSSNKLTGEIPAEICNLSHLKNIDLSSNKLTGDIPAEICNLTQLKTLSLWGNQLTGGIPAGIGNLTQLKGLILSSNNLTGEIPPEICNLSQLKKLALWNNRLTGEIPAGISNISQLETLDLCWNRLTGEIPAEICSLTQLKLLRLNSNYLTGEIPADIYNLTQLKKLELCSNRLTGIWHHSEMVGGKDVTMSDGILPYRLARMLDWLEHVEHKLLPNPFSCPPEAMVSRGVRAVREYFEALLQEEHITKRRDVKIVIIGEAGAGKTSLRRSIGYGEPSPTEDGDDSTVSLDVEHVELDGVWVTLFDCAGQEAYYGLLPKFMTHRAVYLIACDVIKFESSREGNYGEQLERDIQKLEELQVLHWLRCLSWRVPGCDAILVGTKCDSFEDDVKVDIASRMENACRAWLQKWAGTNLTISIEPCVSLTSCKAPDNLESRRRSRFGKLEEQVWPCDRGLGLDGLPTKSLIHRLTHKSDTDAYRGISMAVPRGWNIALSALDMLDANSIPSHLAQRVLKRLEARRSVMVRDEEATTGASSVMTLKKLKEKWLRVVNELRRSHEIPNAIGALDGALAIREFEGRILRQESRVFLDIVWLAMILKPVLNHKARVTFDGDIWMDLGQGRSITLSNETHKASWWRFKSGGILEYELAKALWPEELWEYALETLQSLDLAFPLSSGERSDFVVMLQLREVYPDAVSQALETFRHDGAQVLEGRWKMFLGVPPGAVEKVLTRCCRIGTTETFWRFGVLVQGGFEGETGGTFAMCVEYVEETKMLNIQVHGDLFSVAPWVAFCYAMSAVLSMTLTFPGLKWKASMVCPAHPSGSIPVSREARSPGQQLMTGIGCRVCNPQVNGLGVLAAGVLSVLDVNEPKDAVFGVVEERFMAFALEHPTVQNQMRKNVGTFWRRMGQDLRDTLRGIGKHDGDGGRRYGRGGDAMVEDTRDCDASRVPHDQSSKVDAILEQLQTNTAAVQLLCKGFQNYERSQRDTNLTLKVVKAVMENIRTERYDTPRVACLLVPWSFSLPQGLTPEEQDPINWTRRLVDDGVKKSRGWFRKKVKLFLVCADTYRLVPCGREGHGYDIQQFRTWMKNTIGVLNVMVELTSIVLGSSVASDLSSRFLDAAKDYVEVAEGDDVQSLKTYVRRSTSDGAEVVQKVKPLDGRSYESLRKFIHDQEDEALAGEVSSRRRAGRTRNESSPSFVYFESEMVSRVVDHDKGELGWVLRDSVKERTRRRGLHLTK